MVEHAHVPHAFAARQRIAAAEGGRQWIGEVSLQAGPPVAARPFRATHQRRYLQAGQRRRCHHTRASGLGIGHEAEADRLVVEQQRVRCCVVRAQALAVEGRRVAGADREGRLVEQHVAADLADAIGADPVRQQPEVFDHQFGVAAAADRQIAVEHVAPQRTGREGLGLPCVGRPQHAQRRVGGHQLHGRGRVHRHRLVQQQRRDWRARCTGMVERLDDDADGLGRDACCAQCCGDCRGQGARSGRILRLRAGGGCTQRGDHRDPEASGPQAESARACTGAHWRRTARRRGCRGGVGGRWNRSCGQFGGDGEEHGSKLSSFSGQHRARHYSISRSMPSPTLRYEPMPWIRRCRSLSGSRTSSAPSISACGIR